MTHVDLSRRYLLGATAAMTATATTLGGRSAHAASFDLTDRKNFLQAIVKMRGAVDDRLVIGWIAGTRYAVIDGASTPMFNLLAGTFSRYRKIDDASYEGRSFEIAFYTDLVTGKLLETWNNPITGKRVENVPQTRSLMGKYVITADGLKSDGNPRLAAMNFAHRFTPAVVGGDQAWITEEIRITGPAAPTPGAVPFRYNEFTSFGGKVSDIADPKQGAVPTTVAYHSLVSWSPWMGMEGLVGYHMGRAEGRRVARIEDLHPDYLALAQKYHADVLNDPFAAIEGKLEKVKTGGQP